MATATEESREECLVQLGKGKPVRDLSERCKELLGATARTGLLARRDSAINKTWNPNEGHDARKYTETTFGHPYDKPNDDKSVGEIFLEGKTPEQQEKIRSSIARTASRGAKVRTEDLVTESDILREKKKELERRSSREKH